MLRYLNAAFFVRERVPLLGPLPVNVLAVAAFTVLGFGHPAFWLLGILGETAYLWAVSSSARFRKLVDAIDSAATAAAGEKRIVAITDQLNGENLARHAALRHQLATVELAYGRFSPDDPTTRANLDNLRQLESAFVKLLAASQHITETNGRANDAEIGDDLRELEAELVAKQLSPAARASKEATLELLRKRQNASRQRAETLAEIESDLERIEAQFSLAVESSAIRAKPEELHFDVDLTSRMITTTEIPDQRLSL